MAHARSIVVLCAVVNMAAARITDKPLAVLGLDASGVLPQLCLRTTRLPQVPPRAGRDKLYCGHYPHPGPWLYGVRLSGAFS